MKLSIYSHCAIDSIVIDDSSYEQIGGAACYGGFTAKNLKSDVTLHTKFGSDFPAEHVFKNNMTYPDALSKTPTTRFKIVISGDDRTLYLENQCENITYTDTNADGVIVSPLFDEITGNVFEQIKTNSDFIFLDPQGFLRKENNGKISLDRCELDISKISAIKANADELFHLTGLSSLDGMLNLQKRGVEYVLHTNKREISLLVKDRLYSILLPKFEIHDTTGVGDIFCSAFTCTILKEKDPLWALCFAGGAAQAALESKKVGLEKIPKKGKIETNAAYFYNLLKFEQV
jgi:sugar/nucleoside kinase (ribokinase family)